MPDIADDALQAWLARAQLENEEAIANIRADVARFKQDAAKVFAQAVYGGMGYSAAHGVTVAAGYDPLTGYSATTLAPRAITLDLPAGTFAAEYAGAYLLTVTGSLLHAEAQGARSFSVRLYDVVAGAPIGSGVVFFTPRNTTGTAVNITFPLNVADADSGNPIRLEIGGTSDTFTTTSLTNFSATLFSIGEYQGPI